MWKCHKCGKPVYFAERKQSLGYDWHPECLRCEECGKRLNPGQHAEHKGVPYCHVPCYGALFGPQLFGHGTRVESHKNFGQKGTPRASGGPALPRDHLESKLKLYNQFFDNKSMEVRSREVNNRLVLEGALRVYWGVQGVIHLKEDDDQRTVVTVRKRNSCRYGNSVDIKNLEDYSDKENDNTDNTGAENSSSILDDYATDISMSESMTFETCSLSEDAATEPPSSSEEPSPVHKSVTLPSKLDVKNIEWDEIDDLLQVERKLDDTEKLYQTMPSPLPSQISNDGIPLHVPSQDSSDSEPKSNGVAQEHDSAATDDESTLKPMDFEDFKRSVHEEYLNGTKELQSPNADTLKSNQPIDPSRINDSLKLYSENIMSKSFNCETFLRTIDPYLINDTLTLKAESAQNHRNYVLQKSGSASSRYSPFYENKSIFEKGINRSRSGPNCFGYNTTDSEDELTIKAPTMKRNELHSPKYLNIKMDCYDQSDEVSKATESNSFSVSTTTGTTYETATSTGQSENHVTEDGVVLRRPPKTGASAIKRRSGNKRARAKLKRRCSINGHFYNRETSFFTPPHGSQMSVWVTSLVSTTEVINLLLEKYKVDSRPEHFALFVIRDNGEQRRLKEDDYPLVVRIMLGPHEDVARLFLMDAQETQEISSEVAQFLNLSLPECRAILDRYNDELEREVFKVKERYAEMRRRIIQRMESLKVRL